MRWKNPWTSHGTTQHREHGMEQIPPPNTRPMKKGFIFPVENPSGNIKLLSKKVIFLLAKHTCKKGDQKR